MASSSESTKAPVRRGVRNPTLACSRRARRDAREAHRLAQPRPGARNRDPDLRPFGPRPDLLEGYVGLRVDEFEGNQSPRRLRQEREAPSVPPDEDSEEPQEEDHHRCYAGGDATHV